MIRTMTKGQSDVIDLAEYIPAREAGKIASLTSRRIRQLIDASIIEGKKVYGRWLVSRQSLYAYLAQREN